MSAHSLPLLSCAKSNTWTPNVYYCIGDLTRVSYCTYELRFFGHQGFCIVPTNCDFFFCKNYWPRPCQLGCIFCEWDVCHLIFCFLRAIKSQSSLPGWIIQIHQVYCKFACCVIVWRASNYLIFQILRVQLSSHSFSNMVSDHAGSRLAIPGDASSANLAQASYVCWGTCLLISGSV